MNTSLFGKARSKATLLALSAFALSVGLSSVSYAELLESVVALVNDEPIYLTELRSRATPFLRRAESLPAGPQRSQAIEEVYRQLLERLIEERLFQDIADDESISVSTTELEQAIRNVRTQASLSEAEFWQAIAGQGLTERQYRQDLRVQLLRYKVLNARVRSRVNITEAQLRRRFSELQAQEERVTRVELAHIFVQAGESDDDATAAAARVRAEEIRDSLSTVEDFEEAMATYGGGELGTVNVADLEPALAAGLRNLGDGEISEPIRTSQGYLILLPRRHVTQASTLSFDAMRDELYATMVQQAMERQEQAFIRELMREAEIDRRLFAQ